MLFEQGLEHRRAGAIVSRQMNPRPGWPRPPDPLL